MSVRSSLNHKRLSPASSGSQGGGSPTPSRRSSTRGTRGETADESFNEGLDLLQEAFNRKYFELVNQCKHWERIATQSKQEAEELEDQNRQLKSAVVDLKVRVDALQEQNTSYFDENKALERQKQRAERRLTLLEDQKDAPKAEAPRQALGDIDINSNQKTISPDAPGSAVKKAPRISLGAELEEASMKPPTIIPPRSAKKTTRDSEADAIRDNIRQELQQLRRTSSASVVSVDYQENRRSSISKASRDMLRRRDDQPKSRPSMTSMRSRSSLSRAREASGMDPFTSRRESISPTESLPQDPQRRSSNASMKSLSTKDSQAATASAPQTQKFQAVYAKISKILQGRELKKFHMLIYAFDDKKIKLEPMLAKASELLASDAAVLQEFTDVVKSEMSNHRKQSRSPKEAQSEAVEA